MVLMELLRLRIIIFRKELKDLSLSEVAVLAGLPQAPSRFSPQNNFKAALTRQAYVLSRMEEDGFINFKNIIKL